MSTGGRLADSIQDMCFFIKEMLGTQENKQGSKRASSGSARSCKASPKKKVKQRLDSRCQKASTRKLEVHVSASSSDPGVGVKKEPAKPAEPASSHRDGPRPLPTGQITKLYQQAASSASSFFHTDLSVPTVLRITGDSREAATMHNGPSAFAVAVWSDGHQIVSEIPNLMVDKAAAAKASARKHLQKQVAKRNQLQSSRSQPAFLLCRVMEKIVQLQLHVQTRMMLQQPKMTKPLLKPLWFQPMLQLQLRIPIMGIWRFSLQMPLFGRSIA